MTDKISIFGGYKQTGSNRFADFDKTIDMKYFFVDWKRKIDDLVEDICEVR